MDFNRTNNFSLFEEYTLIVYTDLIIGYLTTLSAAQTIKRGIIGCLINDSCTMRSFIIYTHPKMSLSLSS
jgi:hypothetical protein